MKITIFNGSLNERKNNLNDYLLQLEQYLINEKNSVEIFNLDSMNIKQCIGCFGCWAKQPGKCLLKDDHKELCYSYIHSDFVLFASPLIMGYTSAILKRSLDRLIPLLSYEIELVNKECRHVARYDKYPEIGVLIQKEADTDREDIEIINKIYQRMALNFKSTCRFTMSTEQSIEEVCNEINNN